MNNHRWHAGLAAASLTVALAACGSSSSTSSSNSGSASGSGTLAKPALIARANSICASAQAQAKAVPAPASYGNPAIAAAYFDKVAPITDQETQALAALRPASDVQSQYAAFTAAQQAANRLLQTIRQKADAKDASGLQDLKQAPATGQKVADAANRLGAATCAQ